MSLVEQLKTQLAQAMKSRNEVEKDILRVVLGEVSIVENSPSQQGPITDQQIYKIIRKIMLSNAETMSYLAEDKRSKLMEENRILEVFCQNKCLFLTLEIN